jgi:dTDP-4-amino-4,6-dideoxygalactose transaminase
MQSAVICPQLDQLEALNDRRCNAVRRLQSQLDGVLGLTMLNAPEVDDFGNLRRAYYKVAFRYDAENFGRLSRDFFVQSLRAEGIAFDPGFRGLHLIHASRRFRAADELIETTRADAEMLTLYHPVLLEGDSAIEEIARAIRKVHECASEISDVLGRTA